MTFDDEPYWPTKKNGLERNLKTVAERSTSSLSQHKDNINLRPTALYPSPLLQEYMEKEKNNDKPNE